MFQCKIRLPNDDATQTDVSVALGNVLRELLPSVRFEWSEGDSAWEDKIRVWAKSTDVTVHAYRYEYPDPLEFTVELPSSCGASAEETYPLIRDKLCAAIGGTVNKDLIPPA